MEINNTFYDVPSDETIRNWRRAAPDGFEYTLKTHPPGRRQEPSGRDETPIVNGEAAVAHGWRGIVEEPEHVERIAMRDVVEAGRAIPRFPRHVPAVGLDTQRAREGPIGKSARRNGRG